MLSVGPATATLVEQQTRFLYPFFFKRGSVSAACARLQNATAGGGDGRRSLQIWEAVPPHHLYQEEILDPVIAFLFGHPDTAGCGYLRLTGPAGDRWFNAVRARLHDSIDVPVRLAPHTSIELFLSNHGIGVLSLGLSPDATPLDDRHAIAFNYRLSQLPLLVARVRAGRPGDRHGSRRARR